MGPKASIRDVAAAAGVSVTTVSHVLNNKSGTRVSAQTRERVETVARQLGYAANGLARGLRLQRSYALGLLGDVVAATGQAGRLVLGAQETASARGWVLLLTTGRDPEAERREIRALARHRVDGVLYATTDHRVVHVPDELRPMPVVLLNARSADATLPSVVPDERGGAATAVRELLAHGHRRIGFVTTVDDVPAARGRLLGYREALWAAGVPYRPELVRADAGDPAGGHRAARALLGSADRPTALFCFTDAMAMGVYRAATELGLRVPQDLSVVGCANQEVIADGLFPALTSVALPHHGMGTWAVETMVELLDRPKGARRRVARHVALPCPLVRRASVAAAPH
jgi:LacI family transcriptional regulator